MTALKGLALAAALIVGTSSLAMAQAQGSSGPDGGTSTRATRHHGTRHHRMYMMSVHRTHKGSKLTPANNDKPLSEWLHRP